MTLEEIKEAKRKQVEDRIKEIQEVVKLQRDANIDELTVEAEALIARKKELDEAQADQIKRDKLSGLIKAGQAGIQEVKTVGGQDAADDMIERQAFMNYVLTGVRDTEHLKRANNPGVSSDLGVMIPNTVQQEIIKEVDKIRGSLYSKVRKMNVPGGVEFPVGSFSATFTRIGETGAPTDRQKGGSITGSIVFKYNIGEIRLSKTLLQSLLAVPAFEAEISKTIAEAYVKAMDFEIWAGDTTAKQMEGITKKTGVKTIEFTEAELKDWKSLYKKIMTTIPLALLNAPFEYAMSNGTFMSNFMTLANDNNTPIGQFVDFNGGTGGKINGHDVTLVEADLIPDFDSITTTGTVFGMLWLPQQAYAINTNMQFTVKQYEDNEKNETVTKALVVNDGKVIRPDLIYLLKKKIVAEPPKGQGEQTEQTDQG